MRDTQTVAYPMLSSPDMPAVTVTMPSWYEPSNLTFADLINDPAILAVPRKDTP